MLTRDPEARHEVFVTSLRSVLPYCEYHLPDAPLGRHMRPVLTSILNVPLFLIGNLLLGKLGETAVVHGYAPHNGPRSFVSHLVGTCELPLHESANDQGPRQAFWMAFPDLKAESTPKTKCFFARMHSS